eukprot:TRINITY_DN1277_c0_g1_i1.p1 TRINITY_DN1277_c0_g1~~TRINITY_DN1277_c0_g1_i1.p1  ORF type:complete len:423 (-),score=107.52 TRINITY_DN1277_c0_g1_i1:81-1349(-)
MNSVRILIVALLATAIYAACPSGVVLKQFSASQYTEGGSVSVSVDAGYKLIGGGFEGQYLRESYPSSSDTWTVTTSPVTADVGPAITTAYAIGLYDPENCYTISIVQTAPQGVNTASFSGSAICNYPSILVGGGAKTDRFLSQNFPNPTRGDSTSAYAWTALFASASGFVANSTTGLTVYALCATSTSPSSYILKNYVTFTSGSAAAAAPGFLLAGGGVSTNGGLISASYNSSNSWTNTVSGSTNIGEGKTFQNVALGIQDSIFPTNTPTSAPTNTPTSAPTNTPTSAPTNTPTSAPTKSCYGQINTVARSASQGGRWVTDNTVYQIYDISVQNLGDCPIVRATYDSIFTGPNSPGVSQKWNIDDSPSGDQILGSSFNLFGNSVAPGTTRGGYGVIVYNATGVTFVAKGPTTFCDASCTNSA